MQLINGQHIITVATFQGMHGASLHDVRKDGRAWRATLEIPNMFRVKDGPIFRGEVSASTKKGLEAAAKVVAKGLAK